MCLLCRGQSSSWQIKAMPGTERKGYMQPIRSGKGEGPMTNTGTFKSRYSMLNSESEGGKANIKG